MPPLHVLGVRHHSPACARLVGAAIRSLRPRHVLIEGPADMNDRLGELRLGHTPPIALFTYHRHAGQVRAGWSPFCRHSPEWVALEAAEEVGAAASFMDLPGWSKAFAEVRNRYGDRPPRDRYGEVSAALCRRFGIDGTDGTDALWDHLFEQPMPLEELAARLDEYFLAIRGDDPPDESDAPREDFMLRSLGWALADAERHGGAVVAVCGGFHAPALRRLARPDPAATGRPAVPPPEDGARHGTYLVPYSFHRLDSFVGYDSGMPSPAFYDAVWELGPEPAAEAMLRAAVERLRGRRQHVSPADLIACSTLSGALARLRGHRSLTRIDLLDGIAAALVKDGLDAPLPWSYRGTLRPRTDPLLVEVMAAFSGERSGALAAGTPRPPLLADVAERLEALDLVPRREERAVTLDLKGEAGRARSRALHRLRVLAIPGFVRESGPAWATDAELTEVWRLREVFEAESMLIEAAARGPTLEAAAAARLAEQLLAAAGDLAALAGLLGEAAFAGFAGPGGLGEHILALVADGVHREPSFSALGAAAGRLLALWQHDELFGARGAAALGGVLAAAYDRGLWLAEGIQGPTAAADEGQIAAVAVLRDLIRYGGAMSATLAVDGALGKAVMERRAADAEAPPALRGAALGFLWSLGELAAEKAVHAVRSVARAETLGDFLAGLFALAREEVLAAEGLLAALDEAVCGFGQPDFLIALPSLRLAFSYFPPLERERIGVLALRRHAGEPADVHGLMTLGVAAEEIARGLAVEAAVSATAARYGLEDGRS